MAMFEAGLGHNLVARHETEQALHQAIANDELVVHYQPVVEIRGGSMIGAEALVRWERPGHGLLYPGAFIPVAEESELMLQMGDWILDRVCADLARWPRSKGRSPMVMVNLSARQMTADTLVPSVISALQRHGLQPPRLGFEITESMEIRDTEVAEGNLRRLKQLGCRIAIDDFGIGHATLDYIRRFSMADALKIDRSFVAGLGRSREDTAIVTASVALATSLGLQVVAEGVEDLALLEPLRDLGARYAQGFALGQSVPFDEILLVWERGKLVELAAL
jgi:EAL domain-containing protein (putative c-di-GMP-specific phosphodiesterase class I)